MNEVSPFTSRNLIFGPGLYWKDGLQHVCDLSGRAAGFRDVMSWECFTESIFGQPLAGERNKTAVRLSKRKTLFKCSKGSRVMCGRFVRHGLSIDLQ